eukprot:4662809-Amphidinium_carterae.1
MSASDTVRFNVGGEPFEVLEQMVRSQPDSLLCTLLDDRRGDTTEPIFVQGDKHLFRFILQGFRFRKILLPPTVSLEEMRRECAYFQLPDDLIIQREKLVSALGGISKEVEDCCERAKTHLLKTKHAYVQACSKWQALVLYHEFLDNLGIPSPSQLVSVS